MEQYREKLKITQRITAAAALILACFSIFFFLCESGVVSITPIAGNSHWQSLWRGFIAGASMGIALLMLIFLIRAGKALRSEEALIKFYIQEHDERQIQIGTAARATATQIVLIGGLVAAIIAGYFSMTVGVTVMACVLAHSLIAFSCKLYYSRKF